MHMVTEFCRLSKQASRGRSINLGISCKPICGVHNYESLLITNQSGGVQPLKYLPAVPICTALPCDCCRCRNDNSEMLPPYDDTALSCKGKSGQTVTLYSVKSAWEERAETIVQDWSTAPWHIPWVHLHLRACLQRTPKPVLWVQ